MFNNGTVGVTESIFNCMASASFDLANPSSNCRANDRTV